MRSALEPLNAVLLSLLLTGAPAVFAQDAPAPPPDAAPETAAPEEIVETTPPTEAEIRATIEALSSDDFQEREQATREIWEMGRHAEALLREAVEGDRGELRYRGGRILDEFSLGLYPDTPEEVRKLVNDYRSGDRQQRSLAIRTLAAKGHTDLLSKLVRRERDPAVRAEIAQIFADNAERLAPAHIANGDYDRADQILKLASLAREGMKNYVAFLAGTGKLSAAIEEQREKTRESVIDLELLAWMLRADGQFAEAAEFFEKAGQTLTAQRTLAASGDPLAYAKACIDQSKADIGVLGFKLAVARLEGDTDAEANLLQAIDDYAAAMGNEAVRCFSVLIVNGHVERAFALARKLNHEDLARLALARYDFDEAFRVVGIDDPKAPYDDWLAEFSKNFTVRTEKEIPDAIKPAVDVARICVLTGQKEEAVRILSAVSRLLEKNDESLLEVVGNAADLGLMDFAIETAVKAMELETQIATLERLYDLRGTLPKLRDDIWEHLLDTKPDQSHESALRELGTLLGYSDLGEADAAPLVAAMRKAADDAPDTEKGELLLLAGDLARRRSLHEPAIEAYGAALAHIGDDARLVHFFNYAVALFAAEKYREAAEQFDRAWKTNETNSVPVYFKGLALSRAGDVEQGKALRERAGLMALGNTYTLTSLASNAYRNEDFEFSLAADRMITRLARPDALTESAHFYEAITRIAKVHRTRGEYADAAAAMDISNLALITPQFLSAATPFSEYVDLGKVKVRAALDAGKADEAATLAAKFLKANPSDSSMLEDGYQMLVDQGRSAAADALFDTVYPHCLDAAVRFPGRGQHHNNLAWLLSRCGKKLDQALVHAERAVEVEPDNGAFLDTLAEVHFQRGDREKAIAFSEKAITFLGDDPQVLRQLERFKNGKPTDR